jgi:hypothetical protein
VRANALDTAKLRYLIKLVEWEAHLRKILRAYARYCNDIRTHRLLDKDAPVSRLVQWAEIINSLATLADFIINTSGLGFSIRTVHKPCDLGLQLSGLHARRHTGHRSLHMWLATITS